jgi:hypothetical protein
MPIAALAGRRLFAERLDVLADDLRPDRGGGVAMAALG